MNHPAATATQAAPVIGTMDPAQLARARAATARILGTHRAHRPSRRGRGGRLPAYCGCCGCITRYCICSCCCQR